MDKSESRGLIPKAAGGSATIALGTGVIADISLPHERGKFVGIFQFAGTFSTASRSTSILKDTWLTNSRSSVGRSILIYARMASHLLVPHDLLRYCSCTSSLVSAHRIRRLLLACCRRRSARWSAMGRYPHLCSIVPRRLIDEDGERRSKPRRREGRRSWWIDLQEYR